MTRVAGGETSSSRIDPGASSRGTRLLTRRRRTVAPGRARARACDAGDDATPTNAQVLLIVDTLAHTMMAMDGRISFEYEY